VICAAWTKDWETVKILLKQKDVDLNLNQGKLGLLHLAYWDYNYEMMKFLLQDQRIDVNWKNSQGASLLFLACRDENFPLIQLLLNHPNINPNSIDLEGHYTPLHYTSFHNQTKVAKLLLSHKNIDVNQIVGEATAFFIACQEGKIEMFTLLLNDPRTDLNRPGAEGISPLLILCDRGDLPFIKLLLSSKREIDLTPKWENMSALEIAKYHTTHNDNVQLTREKEVYEEIYQLLVSYRENRFEVVWNLRKELGFHGFFFFFFFFFFFSKLYIFIDSQQISSNKIK